jgi:hypothetical protein
MPLPFWRQAAPLSISRCAVINDGDNTDEKSQRQPNSASVNLRSCCDPTTATITTQKAQCGSAVGPQRDDEKARKGGALSKHDFSFLVEHNVVKRQRLQLN